MTPYPPHRRVDQIIQNLGEYLYHDDLQALSDAKDESAVAEGDEETSASGSDKSDAGDDEAAVADDADKPSVVGVI